MRKEILEAIGQADGAEISVLLEAVMDRYRKLFPDWEIFAFSIHAENSEERSAQLRRILELAEPCPSAAGDEDSRPENNSP